jgi:hypothetical protein
VCKCNGLPTCRSSLRSSRVITHVAQIFSSGVRLEKDMLSEIEDSVLSKHKSFGGLIGLDLMKDSVMAASESAREQKRKPEACRSFTCTSS